MRVDEEKYKPRDALAHTVYELTNYVKNNSDIERAVRIMIEHNITFEELLNRTLRLSIYDIAKMSDIMNKLKK